VLGSFFVTNLFIGVLVNVFKDSSGSALLTSSQQHWKLGHLLARKTTPLTKVAPRGAQGLQVTMFAIATHKATDVIIGVLICLNVIVIVSEHFPQSQEATNTAALVNFIFLVCFTGEMGLKMFAFGPKAYFKDGWSRLDATIIGFS
jgi:hypothetical protein